MLFVKLLIALAVCLQLPVIAFAHPGDTDSNGGHINHSTGEYHYHHGYPAHDHYDMDGDGIPDCPYRFDDKTGSSSNEKESSSNKSEEAKERRAKKVWNYLLPIICCFILYGVVLLVDEIRWRLKK